MSEMYVLLLRLTRLQLISRQGRVPYDAFDGEEKVKVKAKVEAKEGDKAAGEVPVLGDEHPVVDIGDEDDEEGDLDPDYVETEVKE
jgi:hypothetical protein